MKKNKKIAIIGTVGLPANYGGFETLAQFLVEGMSDNYDMSVYCSGKKYKKEERHKTYKGARLIYLPFQANGLQSILYDSFSIIHALFFADVLLILGVSGCFLLPFVRLFTNKKIIVSIDGIEWKRNKWNKAARLYLWAAEWFAVKFSHADISDNEAIQDYTAYRYHSLSNIIEYGADHTIKVKPSAEDFKKYPFLKNPYAFKVCRIEPENNLEIVLDAFSKLPTHTLVVVGNWKNGNFGKTMLQKYASFKNLILLDPIYHQHELDVLRGNCLVYIHGHSAGGTNPSLVEAMYLKLPVIAFNVSYNRTTTENKALYFQSSDQLLHLISSTKICDLKSLSETMKEIADRRYTWKIIANKYDYLIKRVFESNQKHLAPELCDHLPSEKLLHLELAHLQSTLNFFEKR